MKYLLKQIGSLIVVLIISSILVFLMIHIIPGDPAEMMAPLGASADEIEAIREKLGLNRPLISQYLDWISNIVFHFDFGESLYTGTAITSYIGPKILNTFLLAVCGIVFAVLLGIPFGIISALKQNSVFDLCGMVISIFGVSIPIFWMGLLLIMLFSVQLGWLPPTGGGSFITLILPSITIGLNSMAVIARMTRSSMLEVLRQDYIRTAEAKGLAYYKIIFKHTLKNAMIPIITTIGIQFGYLMGGAVLTETVFVYPGVGRLIVDSILRRDYPTIQACLLLLTVMFVVINTLTDIAYRFFDPRIKENS